MRRRDATEYQPHSFYRMDRRTVSSFVIALGVHAALLTILSIGVFRIAPSVELIMVSLTAGGGGGVQSQPPPVAQPAVAPMQPHAPPKVAHGRRRRANRAEAPAVAHAPTAEDANEPSGHSAGSGSVAGIGAGTDALGGSGAGTGVGSGAGAGDQRARCIVCPEPNYPLVARRRGWQGTVEVGLSLLADGSVVTADVRRSCGYEVLDREAVTVARRSRFTPLVAGPAQGRIAYRFELTPPRP